MIDRFQEILHELGQVFQMTLHPDKTGSCSILIPPHPLVTLQLDETQEFLFIFSKIIEIPLGRFLENVLCEALKANGETDPRPGIFCYVALSRELAIYQKFPAAMITGERLASMIGSLLEAAGSWKVAIEQGRAKP
jgi:hypothetical protein